MTTCPDCGNECEVGQIDFGIGPYECWGKKGVHTDLAWVSTCCEAEIPDYDGSEWEDDAAISNYESMLEEEADREGFF